MPNRIRRKGQNRQKTFKPRPTNPYPWMSLPEALVHLELESRNIPFSWRWFDGVAETFQLLMPDFQPEFTLREQQTVILVQGGFFGFLPGVIDRIALAATLLEFDGWKVVILLEDEIRAGAAAALDKKAPELRAQLAFGPPRPNPFGHPDATRGRAVQLSAQGLEKRRFIKTGGGNDRRGRKRRIRRRGNR